LNERKFFRMVLVSYWVSGLIYVFVSVWCEKYLPADLQLFLIEEEAAPISSLDTMFLILLGVISIILIISSIMLFSFKTGARSYFLGALITGWSLGFFSGHSVEHEWAYPINELNIFLGGCVVAFCYFGRVLGDQLPDVDQVFK